MTNGDFIAFMLLGGFGVAALISISTQIYNLVDELTAIKRLLALQTEEDASKEGERK